MTTRSIDIPPRRLWLGLAALVVLPFAEFAAFFWVADRLGLSLTLLLLIATSFLGVSLLRHQGSSAFRRLLRAFGSGEASGGAARESLMLAAGGALMILPGFVTDAIGFGLMVPALLRSWKEGSAVAPSRPARAGGDRGVIDLGRDEWKPVDE
ncbi:FxsA family protein [Labrys monachus]|uniref:UPF0716 family protein affecting phage T7 exclusion n=1 Tax=Labrys monachus TaxID=217067 RepID=A0ABU0FCV9_9HYPH|nr:FxsA family protein [Labrys monachus]MDQ0392456.1 UPF0716 family protein affecting phage T7 exclusion [Labrys monachus]